MRKRRRLLSTLRIDLVANVVEEAVVTEEGKGLVVDAGARGARDLTDPRDPIDQHTGRGASSRARTMTTRCTKSLRRRRCKRKKT